MKNAWHDTWGSARGPIARLAPQTRIVCGACAFAACLTAPAVSLSGAGAIVLCVLAWNILCGPPVKVMASALAIGLAVLLPYFLLAPLLRLQAPSRGWLDALAAPWAVFLRGLATMQVAVATVTTLSAGDLRQGLLRLPVPGLLSAILLQIVHQSHTLLYETRRVAAALAVRGGTSGIRTGLRILASLPRVWLPRIMDRADRVAAAMAVRGYCRRDLRAMGTVRAARMDALAVGLALLGLAGAVALRLGGNG